MNRHIILALSVLALACPAPAAPPKKAPARPAAKPAAARDWTRTIVATTQGGFRMGNPNARVKLVEYGSLTCPHCAHFAVEGKPKLMPYVKSGRVSYEYRNYILNGIDVAASLLARCSGAGNFFRFSDSLYASQRQWVGKVSGLGQAQKDELKALPENQRLVRIGELGGLSAMAAQYGVSPLRAKQCLSDSAALDRLGQMVEAAEKLGVEGTPTFFVGSESIVTQEWADIEPLIKKAGG